MGSEPRVLPHDCAERIKEMTSDMSNSEQQLLTDQVCRETRFNERSFSEQIRSRGVKVFAAGRGPGNAL